MSMIQTYRTLYDKYQALYGDDTCIFLLVGKFYELYDTINPVTDSPYTSILRAARIMNVQVSRKEDGSLFAGVPEQTRDKFAQTLTSRGWTVVIVDQVKNAANKVTDRVTARILSPGTHVEMAGQERMSVAAVYFHQNGFTTSVNDLTTGEVFSLETSEADSILHMYQIYNVTEIVAVTTKSASCVKGMFGLTCDKGKGQVHCVADSAESEFAREEYFKKMFKVRSLMPVKALLGIPSVPLEKSLLFLLRFVEDHFPQQAERLTSHALYNPAKTMRLSNNIIEQLSIITTNGQKSILDIVDHTFSSIGKRALRERILRPITDPETLERRWSQVAWAQKLDSAPRKLIERDLKGIYDLPRLHFKIACGSINAVDILQLFQSYGATFCLIENLADTPLACPAELKDKILAYRTLFTQMFDEGKASKKSQGEIIGFLTDEAGPLTAAVEREVQDIVSSWKKSLSLFATESGIPYTSFNVESYTLTAPRNLYASLNAKKFTGGASGSSGFLKGFSVSLKKSGPLEIQCDAFTAFCQNMMGAEYLLDRVLKEEFTPICDTLWDSLKIQEWITWLGDIDSTLSLAAVATSLKWSKPTLGKLSIDGLRHPLLEEANTRSQYVTHSVSFDTKGWLIYGVNASGKSSLMKATGIAVILAQAGSFVPATAMSLRPYDAAFSRIWSHDNIWAGLSSFAVEVTELSEILRLATDRSLVLGDEVCSGTESSSATALVAATIEALQAKGTHFMFATHLHDLLKVPGLCQKVSIWHLRVITTPSGKLIYDRSLQPGSGSSCYGLEVAKAMGLPYEIIQRAHDIRRGLEGTVTVQDAPKSRYNSQIQRRACEVCGSNDVRDLEVHHIEEQAKGGSNQARNLAVLCEGCHDDHHNKKIEVTPLTQTSEGLERIVTPAASAGESSFGLERFAHVPKADSNTDLIKQIVLKHQGRPAQRIASILQEEHGIKMSATQVKRYIK